MVSPYKQKLQEVLDSQSASLEGERHPNADLDEQGHLTRSKSEILVPTDTSYRLLSAFRNLVQ